MVRGLKALDPGSMFMAWFYMVIGTPGIGDTVCATVESDSCNKQVLSKKLVKDSRSNAIEAKSPCLVVREISIDINFAGVVFADTSHPLCSVVLVITGSISHRRDYNLSFSH
jgi:hypothetical protein